MLNRKWSIFRENATNTSSSAWTATKPHPFGTLLPGRKYVRCPCNCLLICKNTSQRIACPRPNCKRVISLGPSGPPAATPVPSLPGMCRVTCAHCHDNFLFNTANNVLARCPHCRKISSVGGDFRYIWLYFWRLLNLKPKKNHTTVRTF